jgi:hypothetical protein
MHERGSARLVHKIDVKALAGRERDARVAVRPNEAKYARRFAIDGEGSGARRQANPGGAGFGRGSSSLFCQEGDRAGDGNAGRKDLPAG